MKHNSRTFKCAAILLWFVVPPQIPVHAQQKPVQDTTLQRLMEDQIRGFHGGVGAYVWNLKTGQCADINADSLFPTASMIKMSILCALFDRINKGELKYNQELVYRDSLKYDDGVTGSFRDSTKIMLSEIVMLMITLSDNTAALWCQQLAGNGTGVNNWLEASGFQYLRDNSRAPGREAIRSVYGWGVTTPREMARLLTMIRMGQAVSPDASEEMFRVLSKPFWDEMGVNQIPPTIHVASKNGAVDAAKSETDLVGAPSGEYVFCVTTKNQADRRWAPDNEGYVLIRKISRALWKYFEPNSTWSQPAGYDKWMK
ncbi:MAG TPA: serine hydrolase [Bacteroidota bacterium]|nr:serine hydrolase [Bacteroidota bacterium]